MPDPGTKPPSPTKLVGLVAAAAGATALLLLWLILRPPPSHYRTVVGVVAIASVVTGAVVILTGLVRLVEYRFTRRYNDAEKAQREHRQFIKGQLDVLITQQQAFGVTIAKIGEAIEAIDDRTQKNSKHIKTVETQVGRCMAEIGILAESIDELREFFVEDGLSGR